MTDILHEAWRLPTGFPPGLLLAIALAEGAADGQWTNLKPDGILQVTNTECFSQNPPGYNDTHDGFLRNVVDAICVLKKGYDLVQRDFNSNNYNHAFESVPDWTIVLTVLRYNVTYYPIETYQLPGNANKGNPQYLRDVAREITSVASVSSDFGCQFQLDSHMSDDLMQGQAIVDSLVKTWKQP